MKRAAWLTIIGILSVVLFPFSSPASSEREEVQKLKVAESYGNLPLSFVKNQGQVEKRVAFYLQGPQGTIYFTREGIVYDLLAKKSSGGTPEGARNHELKADKFERCSFFLRPARTDNKVQVRGVQELPGKVNYLVGNAPTEWHTDIPLYREVVYEGLYPGVDLRVYGTNNQMEYDFIVQPGADPGVIKMDCDGIDDLRLDNEGNLLIETPIAEVKHLKPRIYQEIGGKRQAVEGSFTIAKSSFSFIVKDYDKTQPLVIDPLTLSYSTYLGGSGEDTVESIAVDSSGNAYVTGETASPNFPTRTAYQASSHGGGGDVFVTKLNPSGNGLVFSTYLGGGNLDSGSGIAVDSSGNVYVTGSTASTDFPTRNALSAYGGGTSDAFFTKLNSSGSSLAFSTYLGGAAPDYGSGIAVDSSGNAYVTGHTYSPNFPTRNAYQTLLAGGSDAFVTKYTSAMALGYSTYLGGTQDDHGWGIAVDSSGNAYVTGDTGATNFPTRNAYQTTLAGGYDAFVTKLNPSGTSLVFSTYLGGGAAGVGGANDYGYDIAIDSSGNVYVAGTTQSPYFPTQNAYQSSLGGVLWDAFITKLNSSGSSLVFSTFLGGSLGDYGSGIAIDSSGNAYVTGYTHSTDFPIQNAYQATLGAGYDAFVTSFNSSGTSLAFSTYLGSGMPDYGVDVAVDSSANIYVTGNTSSFDFPTQSAYQSSIGGSADTFVSKFLGTGAPPPSPPTVTATNPASNASGVDVNGVITATFSKQMNPSTITSSTFYVGTGTGYSYTQVAGTISYSGTVATFTPSAPLAPNTLYSPSLTTGVTDLAGNHMVSGYSWSFMTGSGSALPPTVIATNPASNASGVSQNGVITATFSEQMNPSTITSSTFYVGTGTGYSYSHVPGTISYSGTVATFTPSAALAPNTLYSPVVTNGVTGLAGNHMVSDYGWSFMTGTGVGASLPSVIATNPASNASGVSRNVVITATFSKQMNPSTITSSTFYVGKGTGYSYSQVPGTISYSGTLATFTPSAALAPNTLYSPSLTTGVTDLAGNHMVSDYGWSFRTGTQQGSAPVVADPSANPGQVPADGASATLLTVRVTDQSNDLASVLIDLSSLGGDFSQPMYDDGTHGDATAADGVYSIRTTVSSSIAVGQKVLPVIATDQAGSVGTGSISVSVIDEAPGLYFPHIVSDGIWDSEVAIINPSATAVTGTLRPFGDSGAEISTPLPVSLAPYGRRQVTVSQEFTFAGSIGYLVFESDSSSIKGYSKLFRPGNDRVALPVAGRMNSGTILIPHLTSTGGWQTQITLVNTTSSTITADLEFSTGQTSTLSLGAGERRVFTVADLFGGEAQDAIISGLIQNGAGLIGAELFSTGALLSGVLLEDRTAQTIYYPHVAGTGGWWTGLVAYNPSTSPCTLTVTPYSGDGTALTTVTQEIPAGQKYIGTAESLGLPAETAWMQISGTSETTGFELFGSGQQLAGYTGVGIRGKEGVFAKIEKQGWTGIAFVNTEDTTATVTLTAYDDSGAVVATATKTVEGYLKVVDLAESLFSQDISTATYLSYNSDKEVVGFQLNSSSDNSMLDALPGL